MVFLLARLIAAVMLLLALGRWPYDFFTIMRWVVCAVSSYAAYSSGNQMRRNWAGTFVLMSIAFNPIVPVHVSRSTWRPIDVLAAAVLLVSVVDSLRRHEISW